MAVVTRRYARQGVVNATLTQRVGASSAFNTNASNAIDVDVDNATTNATQDLDEFMASIGFTLDAAATLVQVTAHGSRHTSAGADAVPLATIAVAGIMSAADKLKLDGIASNANPGIIFCGNQNVGSAADTRFLSMGAFEITTANATELGVAMAHAGTMQNFFMRHNSSVGDGDTVVYTVRKNAADTTLTVTIASNVVSTVSDTTHSFTFVAGDRISVKIVKALSITNGSLNANGSMEIVP